MADTANPADAASASSGPTRPTPLGANFWRLWSSSGLSNLADGIFQVALPLVAIGLTRDPTLLGGLTFALTLPWLLFALPVGAIIDRVDRRRAMLNANTVRLVLLALLTLAVGLELDSIWLLYVVALTIGVTETFYDTAGQSIVPQLVGSEQLSRANGRLYAVELTANQFVGPPLAGFLMAAGAVWALGLPAGLWLLAVGALLLVRGRFRVERTARSTLRSDIAEGLKFLWRNPLLRTMSVMVGLFNLASNAIFSILVLYAVGPSSAMGMSAAGYGVLLTTLAVGSLAGSFCAPWCERRLGRSATAGIGWLLGALPLAAPAVSSDPVLIGATFVVSGFGIVLSNVVMVSLRQRITPDRLLGRVNSGHRLVAWGTRPLGSLLGGLLADGLGLRPMFAIMGGLAVASTAGMLVLTNARMDAAEQDARD